MDARELLLLAVCLGLLGGMRITSTTTTTTLVAAISIANQDLERYFRSVNTTQTLASEERIAVDVYTYAFLNYTYVENQQMRYISFNEEKARYGEGKILTVHGKLVHISDAEDIQDDTACSSNIFGTNGLPTPAVGISWIALVRRGRCTFEEKVKNVHTKGAAGVIIYNDKPVMSLEKMQIKGKTRNITAVITYQDIGLDMAMRLDQGIEVTARIIEGRSGMRPINSLNRTSVLFVAISFIILMVISLVWLIFYYIQKFRYMQSKDQQSRHLCSVTKKAIMKIPTKTGKSTDEKDAESDCCAICIEAYKASDLIRVLPCKHEFHKSCIDPWLIEHRTCPMCKLDVLKFYGYVVGDEIHTTPSPQHMPAINTTPVDDTDEPVVVVVVGVVPRLASSTPSTNAPASIPPQHIVHHPPSSPPPPSSLASSLSLSATASSSLNPPLNSRFSATQASVETQTVSSIEPHSHSSQEYEPYYHRQTVATTMPEIDETDYRFQSSSPSTGPTSTFQVSTASRQFLGSEESILEYEPDPVVSAASTNNTNGPRQSGAVADLIRSRDFVIDFPRIFVLEAGGTMGRRDSVLIEDLPERSQSSMAFPQAKDWMNSMTNKLEEQHGLRRTRKSSQRTEMQENLLMVRYDSTKTRRSRSAEGRYFVRPRDGEKESADLEGACGGSDIPANMSRRNSNTSTQPQQSLKFDILSNRIKSKASRSLDAAEASRDSSQITIKINDIDDMLDLP